MQIGRATAIANPNIALIKYWGNRDERLRLPANASLSMNLAGLETRTTVAFDEGLAEDEVTIGGEAGIVYSFSAPAPPPQAILGGGRMSEIEK